MGVVVSVCEARPASYPMDTRGPFPGDKSWLGRDTDHSPPSRAEEKIELQILSPMAPALW
jgi:hypothetical protein